jgi:hypothetical protein
MLASGALKGMLPAIGFSMVPAGWHPAQMLTVVCSIKQF